MTDNDDEEEQRSKLPGILSNPRSTHAGSTETDSHPSDPPEASDEEAFALVGNGIRAEIVRTLGRYDYEHSTESTLSFSDLREKSNTDIVSSQFNYHLQKLVGRYVEKAGDGYRLRPEGKNLYRTIRAGTFTRGDSLAPIGLQQSCYYCDSELELAYDDGMFTVQCHECETLYDLILAPPSALRTDDHVRSRVVQYNYHLRQAFARGVCPTCMNALTTEFVNPSDTGFTDVVEREIYVYRACDYCGNHSYLSLGSVFLHHPAVIGFCYERGLNVMETPRWELAFAATDRHVTVRSKDPMEVSLTITADNESLELIVNEELAIRHQTVSSNALNDQQ